MSENNKPETGDYGADIQNFNHLAAAEMDEEGNYNMIDGVINNAKPSILEHLRQYKPQQTERGGKPERAKERG
jgi:hypothetical protein